MNEVTIITIQGSTVSQLSVINFLTVEEAAAYFTVLIGLLGVN